METISLILTSVDANSNKYWEATLHDDGSIDAEYGRVGGGCQTTHYGSNRGGKRFLDKKVKEKKKKGYVEQKTVKASGESGTASVVSDVGAVAQSQIKLGDPLLSKLVDRLVRANIHQITEHSQITFDDGVFQTPLGVVTSEGIAEATDLLTDIHKLLKDDKTGTKKYYSTVGEYLTVVPQHVGRTVKGFIDSSFSSDEALKQQQDLLQSLQVSYDSLTSQKAPEKKSTKQEKVFDVEMHLLDDPVIDKGLKKQFYDSKKDIHNYGNIKVENIYTVDIKGMSKNFDSKKWGNVQQFYHGTNIANCLSIMKSGLKVSPPSTAAIAGKMFGNGVYGANSSSKSLGYSLGRWGQGHSSDGAWLFICEFAMGKTDMVGRNSGFSSRYPKAGYDSVSALAANTSLYNDEFIVYHNDQVNIKYLIECSA